MQLLSVILYSHGGEMRPVAFRTGELNIVTGESATGKSALLTIVEYCLGRDSMLVPVGPITDSVAWYAALWDLGDGARAFVARPAPAPGRASTQRAMLEFGADLEALPFVRLEPNVDSDALRTQLGRRIGIEENLQQPPAGSVRQPLEAHLGHAAWFCLQGQSEIANQNQLFHRQGERGVDDAIRDTLPYFLGAAPRDQALRRAQLRDARRQLSRAEAAVQAAEVAAGTIEVELRSLLVEARAAGLTDVADTDSRAEVVAALIAARHAPERSTALLLDRESQTRRADLVVERDAALADLRASTADRDLLLEQQTREAPYRQALELQAGRLTSLNLLGLAPSGDGDPGCPVCGQALDGHETTAEDMRSHLEDLRRQLQGLSSAQPARRAALDRLERTATEARDRLAAAEEALASLRAADLVSDPANGLTADFTRGRLDATLGRVNASDDLELQRLRNVRDNAARAVAALQDELDDADAWDQVTSRLLVISQDMTRYAEQLELEHRSAGVRLDLARLTVVTDSENGPAPLSRIGSAENWIGYHLVTHLALHRYFVRQGRPVPRLLILDQPTQAYYPSEVARETGLPETDADRAAVLRLFGLIRDVVAELAPELQVIVCDHANLPEDWFQNSVAHNWRNGTKLVPQSWIG